MGDAVSSAVQSEPATKEVESGTSAPAPTPVVFAPPRRGMWELETTHHGVRPLSPIIREAYVRAFEAGTKVVAGRYGLPLEGVQAELVHGCMYVRPQGLGEGDKPSPTPPKLIMKLVARLHPGMRRRNRAAAQAWPTRRWRRSTSGSTSTVRCVVKPEPGVPVRRPGVARRRRAGRRDQMLLAHFETHARRNLETHGGDLMPVGDCWPIASGGASRGRGGRAVAGQLAGDGRDRPSCWVRGRRLARCEGRRRRSTRSGRSVTSVAGGDRRVGANCTRGDGDQ